MPASYGGRLVVLRPESAKDARRDLGWSTVSGQVDTYVLPGDHNSCLTLHVETTAARLRACLDDILRS